MCKSWCRCRGMRLIDFVTLPLLMKPQRQSLYDFLRKEAGVTEQYVMPVPFFNVLNGGVHSGNTMAFQEVMIAPVDAPSFEEAMRMGSEVYQRLKKVIAAKYGPQGKSQSILFQKRHLMSLKQLVLGMRVDLLRPSHSSSRRLIFWIQLFLIVVIPASSSML